MGKAMTLTVDKQGLAELMLDLEGESINKFSSAVLEELVEALDEAAQNQNIKALLIRSAKPGIWVAGADVKELGRVTNTADAEKLSRRGHAVFQQMENLPFPTIAVIDGACLGGGLEFALACTYRLATDSPKTQLGLPEVKLGIIPGWGGTQRLPRLIGLVPGLNMVLQGKAVDGKKAWKMKLVDGYIPAEFAQEHAEAFAREVISGKGKDKIAKRRKEWNMMDLAAGVGCSRKLIFNKTRKTVQAKTKGQYPAPLMAIDLIQNSFTKPLEQGLAQEAKTVGELLGTQVAKNLFQLFLTSEELKKDPGLEQATGKPKEIKRTAVLGAGVMGAGIAWLFSHKGYTVRFKDVDWDAIGKGFKSIAGYYQQLIKIRKLKQWEVDQRIHRISGTTSYAGFQHVDMVVEAIVENMDVKKAVLPDLEKAVKKDCLIFSNTSSLSVSEIAECLERPENFAGLHFFNPVNRMPLVEVVAGEKTSPETIETAVEMMKKAGKTPIVVKDCAGFLVNRILIPSLNEAGWMLEEGASVEDIDRVVETFGLPMGSMRLADEVGIDVCVKAAGGLERAYGNRMRTARIFQSIAEKGLLGRKGGKGFYVHQGKKATINPEIQELLPSGRPRSGAISEEEIVDRITLIMINEASRCLDEEICRSSAHVDMALIMGAGFPPFRGGLLRYADTLGIDTVVGKLEDLAKKHGERFLPSDYLKRMQQEKKSFYN